MDAILEMRDIHKSFGHVKALRGVSISLHRAEILGLMGENGAGKSTLMKILSGSIPAGSYEGTILINGREQVFHTPIDSEKAGIEMIYQEISMHPDLSIAENIFLGKVPTKHGIVDYRGMERQAREYMEQVGLSLEPGMKVRQLSTSQQQMVAIARALSRDPKVLILDEPTSALTEAECDNLMEVLRKLRSSGISCVYISHKMKEVFRICDRITTLRDGQTINTTVIRDENTQSSQIIEEMIGRKLDVMYPKQQVPIGREVLRVEHLTVPSQISRKKNQVEDLSFKVHAGEIVALGGLVGAGRSEAVNALFGALRKTSGDVYIEGKKVEINSPVDAVEAGIGLVTEDRKSNGIISVFSIARNISLASLKKIRRHGLINFKQERQIAQQQMDDLQIKAPGIETQILNLSGGNMQKVVLGKWLCKDLKVLIMDEPTRGIDVGSKAQIYNIMTDLVKKGVAIVMISSELPELVAMCDRMYVLAEGRLTAELVGDEINETNMMRAAIATLHK